MSNRAKAFLLLVGDAFFTLTSVIMIIWLRSPERLNLEFALDYLIILSAIFPIWLLMIFIEGLYSIQSFQLQNTSIVGSLLRASFVTMVYITALRHLWTELFLEVDVKSILLPAALVVLPYLYLWRLLFFTYYSNSIRRRKTVVLGEQQNVDYVTEVIGQKPYIGFNIIKTSLPIPSDAEVLVIERDIFGKEVYDHIFSELEKGLEIIDLANFSEMISGKIPLDAINESWFIEHCGYQKSRSQKILTSLFDKTIALSLFFILIIPFTVLILPLLLIFHGRPIFFKQTRIGLYNKPFTLYKLRTMVVDAEKSGLCNLFVP